MYRTLYKSEAKAIYVVVFLLVFIACTSSEETLTASIIDSKSFAIIDPQSFVSAGGLPAETHVDWTDRHRFDLNGTWRFRFDDDDVGVEEKWYDAPVAWRDWDSIIVPGTWDLHHPQGFDRQTAAWYAYTFTPTTLGKFIRLHFEGIFREARVWLNGIELGRYDLPYLPFNFDVSEVIRPDEPNNIVVRVDNRLTRDTLPCDTSFNPGRHGWFPYGGVTRPVYLEGGMGIYAARVMLHGSLEGLFDAKVFIQNLTGTPETVEVSAWITKGDKTVLEWQPISIPGQDTGLSFIGKVSDAWPWSPENPDHYYCFHVRLSDSSGVTETAAYDFGFRTFTAEEGRFYLNGTDRFLRGINRHEDHPEYGPVFNEEVIEQDLNLIIDLNVDFIRPGHYPNDVRVLKALEGAGIMIAEEMPVYQLDEEQMADDVLIDRAKRALQTMILRDFNRPGVVMWSVANEIHNWAKTAPEFIRLLYDTAKALDPHRPVMVAALTVPLLSEYDVSSGIVDVIGVNEYFGWYVGETKDAAPYLEKIHSLFPDRTFIISEYGAGTLQGRHLEGDPGEEPVDDHSYSEEFQVYFHRQHLQQFASLGFIRGVMPWVFADFRMQWTPTTGDPHPIPLINLKGLVSDHRVPKAAYNLLAEQYQNWPPSEK